MSLKAMLENKTVISCRKDASIEEIAGLMEENDVGAIVIVDNDKPVGMVTDRDLVLRCLSQGQEGLNQRAEDVMSSPVETVAESAGVYELIDHMSEQQIRRICVVNDSGQCTAVVSLGDLMELLTRELGKLMQASTPEQEKLISQAKSA